MYDLRHLIYAIVSYGEKVLQYWSLETCPWKSFVSVRDPSLEMETTPTVMSSLHDTIRDDENTTL